MHKRKLIEVALPLEAINRESAREKSIRHGHPSTLHLWWSRKPLATARAVLFAQLVDDPSARPEEFPTEDLQRAERERLHGILERLVVWENLNDESLFNEARREIQRSFGEVVPEVLDPFAGGGSIPLEAQRLGLRAVASDLNPVAALLNRALIELPPKVKDRPPVFPGLAVEQLGGWRGTQGLAADVRAYGEWIRQEAEKRIGDRYPGADGKPVIAWLWVRTVACPNPACGIDMPLTSTWWLSKAKGREALALPIVVDDAAHPSGRSVQFEVITDLRGRAIPEKDGSVRRTGATCIACDAGVAFDYVRQQSRDVGLGRILMATVVDAGRRREYLSPETTQTEASDVGEVEGLPSGTLTDWPGRINVFRYGLTDVTDLFTPRQALAMVTFSDLVSEARSRCLSDGADTEYADVLATYLGLSVSRCADYWSSICSWHNTGQKLRNVFARQAIPMVWNYAEAMPFSNSSGGYAGQLAWVARAIENLPGDPPGIAKQQDAARVSFAHRVVSTDPPYYDNIDYSGLSDFFYVWLRRTLRTVHPDILGTMLVPKADELVANPYRHGGKSGAKDFFEKGFQHVFAAARAQAPGDVPATVYYAFKQSDSGADGTASTGWETLLDGMIRSGWQITSTWPVRSEMTSRSLSHGQNTLASSIVLSLRHRVDAAPTTDRRGFIEALTAELPDALRKLQQGAIAPVDLPQAAIGPGMSVFSRYSAVLEPDGQRMTVRAALGRINEILDQVLNEQEGDFDAPSRFAIAWYRQHGYGVGRFGDADNLARARNTSVEAMDRDEILTSRAGNVQLVRPVDLPWQYDVLKDLHTSNWEALHHLIKVLERDGIAPAGNFLQVAMSRPDGAVDSDLVKELAHLLFRIAEGNGWTKDALSFNSLVTSWPEILEVARSAKQPVASQGAFDFDEDE